MTNAKRLAFKVLLVGCTVAATIAAAEWMFRFWFEEPSGLLLLRGTDFHRVYFETDPIVGVVRKPNIDFHFRFPERPSGYVHFRTNNFGLRRSEPTKPEKAAGVTRVLVLGDSQLDGSVDNEENLASVLETKFAANSERLEVLNAATGSYSPYQSYLWFRSYGAKLEPDIVIFGVFVGNDLAELLTPGRPRLIPENGSFREEEPSQDFLERMKVTEHDSVWSRFNSYLQHKSALFATLTAMISSDVPSSQGAVAEAYSVCIGCTAQSLGQLAWFSERGGLNESIEILNEILFRLKRALDEHNANLLLLLIPTRTQVEPELDSDRIERVCRILKLNVSELKIEDEICDRLTQIAREMNVPIVDLRPVFLETHQSLQRPMYYTTDWHLNVLAHETMADRLLEELEKSPHQ